MNNTFYINNFLLIINKYISLLFIPILFLLALSNISCKSNKKVETPILNNKYEENIISLQRKSRDGTKDKGKLNDFLYIHIYIPDYTPAKGQQVCDYYIEYYSNMAKELNNKLTLEITVWDKKVPIAETAEDYRGENYIKDGVFTRHKNERGGILYNYNNKVYKKDFY